MTDPRGTWGWVLFTGTLHRQTGVGLGSRRGPVFPVLQTGVPGPGCVGSGVVETLFSTASVTPSLGSAVLNWGPLVPPSEVYLLVGQAEFCLYRSRGRDSGTDTPDVVRQWIGTSTVVVGGVFRRAPKRAYQSGPHQVGSCSRVSPFVVCLLLVLRGPPGESSRPSPTGPKGPHVPT